MSVPPSLSDDLGPGSARDRCDRLDATLGPAMPRLFDVTADLADMLGSVEAGPADRIGRAITVIDQVVATWMTVHSEAQSGAVG